MASDQTSYQETFRISIQSKEKNGFYRKMMEKCERIRMPRLSEFKRIGGWKATEQALSYHKIVLYKNQLDSLKFALN